MTTRQQIRSSAACVLLALLAGCAGQQPMQWTKVRSDAQDLAQVAARCDYETTAATQGTDYSFRSGFGQELDRAMRKRDLEKRCMLSNGYALQAAREWHQEPLPPRTPEQLASAARYRALDDEMSAAKQQRAAARDALTASPTGPSAAQLSAQIIDLNAKVFDLESKLGYVKSRPISSEPLPAAEAAAK